MATSEKSLKKIKELEDKRHHDSDAQREWEKLVLAYDREHGTQTPPDPKGPELVALIEKLAEERDERAAKGGHKGHHGHHDLDDCCGRGDDADDLLQGMGLQGIDMETLAERVFERLIFEVRIERERVGWSA